MRRYSCGRFGHRVGFLTAAAAVLLLMLFPGPAFATPPANDNRAAPTPIAAFPATVEGTTVEAAVERLDPQVSQCGRVESTVWYRIDLAPDGTVVLTSGRCPVAATRHSRRGRMEVVMPGFLAPRGRRSNCCYCGRQLERVRSARVRLPNAFVICGGRCISYGRRNR